MKANFVLIKSHAVAFDFLVWVRLFLLALYGLIFFVSCSSAPAITESECNDVKMNIWTDIFIAHVKGGKKLEEADRIAENASTIAFEWCQKSNEVKP